MKLSKINCLILSLGLAVFGCLFIFKSALAASTDLNQQILPLNCIFQAVDDGTGTLYYFTPEACGLFVSLPADIPVAPAIQQPASDNSIYVSNTDSETPLTSNIIELGRLDNISTEGQSAITLVAEVGQIYSFVIDDSLAGGINTKAEEKHTLQINRIDLSDPAHPKVTITLRSKPLIITLAQGQTAIEDLNGDGKPSIGITANSITSSGVKLTIWHIPAGKTPGAVVGRLSMKPNPSGHNILGDVLAGAAALSLMAYILQKKRRQKHFAKSDSSR